MKIESPKYQNDPLTGQENHCIKATINGMTAFIPIDPDNADFAEIQKQIAAGTLTIEDAD